MLYAAYSLFLLRKLSFEHFEFPRWQAILWVTLIGVLVGISTSFSLGAFGIFDEDDLSLHQSSALMLLCISEWIVIVWVYYFIFVAILCWWMKRSNRFDGHGNLFNLVIASGLVCNLLPIGLSFVEDSDSVGLTLLLDIVALALSLFGFGLSFVGDSDSVGLTLLLDIVALALSLYGYWVLANALSGAIPKASLGYSIGGVIIADVIIIVLLFFILVTFPSLPLFMFGYF